MNRVHRTINQWLKDKYGEKVYKVALNAGLTCPNRDGTVGTGGCIFCSERGSGDFAGEIHSSISEQLMAGKAQIRKKVPNCNKFIAYFQAFTNTYGPIDYLRKIFHDAAEDEEVVIISIATRPDCLGNEVLELLEEINKIKPVWVELGLQTIHPSTAEYINRGYKLSVYDKAVSDLKNLNITVITHVILGLPGETHEDMLSTIGYVCKSGASGIKLQLLHVLQGTKLAEDYNATGFHIMSLDEYVDLLKKCISIIPENVIIHRLTGDGPKSLLIEPQWTANKKQVLNRLMQEGIL